MHCPAAEIYESVFLEYLDRLSVFELPWQWTVRLLACIFESLIVMDVDSLFDFFWT